MYCNNFADELVVRFKGTGGIYVGFKFGCSAHDVFEYNKIVNG